MNDADSGASLESTHVGHDKVGSKNQCSAVTSRGQRVENSRPSISVYRDDISHFAPMVQEVLCKLVGALIDLAISKSARISSCALGFDDTFSIWKLLGIGCKYLMDCYNGYRLRTCLIVKPWEGNCAS